jgi:hypothetical protein
VRIREALDSVGRDAAGFQTTSQLPLVRGANEQIDLDATMEGALRLVEGGVTDLRIQLPLPGERALLEDQFRPIVEAFRAAVGRS